MQCQKVIHTCFNSCAALTHLTGLSCHTTHENWNPPHSLWVVFLTPHPPSLCHPSSYKASSSEQNPLLYLNLKMPVFPSHAVFPFMKASLEYRSCIYTNKYEETRKAEELMSRPGNINYIYFSTLPIILGVLMFFYFAPIHQMSISNWSPSAPSASHENDSTHGLTAVWGQPEHGKWKGWRLISNALQIWTKTSMQAHSETIRTISWLKTLSAILPYPIINPWSLQRHKAALRAPTWTEKLTS